MGREFSDDGNRNKGEPFYSRSDGPAGNASSDFLYNRPPSKKLRFVSESGKKAYIKFQEYGRIQTILPSSILRPPKSIYHMRTSKVKYLILFRIKT